MFQILEKNYKPYDRSQGMDHITLTQECQGQTGLIKLGCIRIIGFRRTDKSRHCQHYQKSNLTLKPPPHTLQLYANGIEHTRFRSLKG